MDASAQILRRYVLAKQDVAASVQAGHQLAQDRGCKEAEQAYRDLQVRLAEDRFNLAVVGQFKRGKSSLMNALIGRDLLPTGLLPLTSAITTLRYGPQESVVLRRKGWVLEQEIPLEQLAEYITEQGNPGNEKGVIEARVELPAPFLRRGLHFVDTPGVGSAQTANTETTYAFLPQADAVIFVTSVEAPLSEVEESFLRDIRQHVRRLFIVVNKIDLLAAHERTQVLAYARAVLTRTLGTEPRVYPVSARQALAARLRGDDADLQASGLTELETELAAFLSLESGPTFLVSILDRALRLLDEPCAMPAAAQASAIAATDPAELRRQMVRLRDGLLNGHAESTGIPPSDAPAPGGQFSEQVALSRARHAEPPSDPAAEQTTCPVCAAQTQALLDLFVETQFILSASEDAQSAFAREHGFCPIHTWHFQPLTSPQGLSAAWRRSSSARWPPYSGSAKRHLPTRRSMSMHCWRRAKTAWLARCRGRPNTAPWQSSCSRSRPRTAAGSTSARRDSACVICVTCWPRLKAGRLPATCCSSM